GIGHGDERAAAIETHQIGLVVVAPVADVFAARGGEVIERVPGLLQARAEPPRRALARVLLDGDQGIADDLSLLARSGLIETASVAFVMSHPLPLALRAFLDDLRMLRAQIAVERNRAPDAVAVENVHDAEHPDAVAVVAFAPHHDVRNLAAGAIAARPLLQ